MKAVIDSTLERLYDGWLAKTGDANAAATLTAAQLRAAGDPVAMDEAPLNPGDIARLFKVSPHKVLEWIRTGQLKAANIAKGSRPRYVIQRADVDRFLQSRQPDPPVKRRRAG